MRLISAFSFVFRLAKWLLAVGALVAFSALAALYLLVTPEWLSGRLESYCAETFLVRLQLKSPPLVNLLPRMEITLPAGSFADLRDNQELGSFSSARLHASPWWLLLGQVRILDASVQGFHTSLAIPEKDLPVSWDSLLIPEKGHSWISPVSIERLSLSDSSLEVRGLRSEPCRIFIKEWTSSEIAPTMTSPFQASGQISSPSDRLLADFSASGTLDLDASNQIAGLKNSRLGISGKLGEAPLEATVGVAAVQVTGERIAGNARIEADVKGALPLRWSMELQDLSTKDGVIKGKISDLTYSRALAGGMASAKASAVAAFDLQEKNFSFDDGSISCSVDSPDLPAIGLAGTVSGRYALASRNGIFSFAGKLNDSAAKLSGRVSSDPEFSASFDITAESLDLNAKNATQFPFTLQDLSSLLHKLPGSPVFSADVRAMAIRWGSLEGHNFKAHLSSGASGLSVSDAVTGIAGGEVEFALKQGEDAWETNANFSGLQLAALFPQSPERPFTGTLSGSLSLSGIDNFPFTQTKRIQGHGKLLASSGELTGPGNKTTAFSEAVCQTSIQNGILACEDMEITMPRLRVSGKAVIDLESAEISGTPAVRLQDGRELASSLGGKYYDPKWTLPEEALVLPPAPVPVTPPAEAQAPEDKPLAPAQPAQQAAPLAPSGSSGTPGWVQKFKTWLGSLF